MNFVAERAATRQLLAGAAVLVICVLVICAALLFASDLRADTIGAQRVKSSTKTLDNAIHLIQTGHLKEADALLQRIQSDEPGYLTAILGRAQIAADEHQIAAAEQMVDTVLARQSRLPEAHNMKGFVLLLRKDESGARREFNRAIELQPKYVTPRIYLAILDRSHGDLAGAANEYKQVIDVAPRLPAGYLGEAEALSMLHRENDAVHVLESWKVADPKTLMPYRVLANVYLADHRPQLAIEQLQAAVAKDSRDAVTLAELGDAYATAGNASAAAAEYQAALAVDPHNLEAAIGLGSLEAAAGQNDRALVHFRQALATDPKSAVAANDVAWTLTMQGRAPEEALQLAQGAVRRDPNYADAYDTIGWIHYRRGEYAQAIVALKRANALQPRNLDFAAHLGLAYAKAGDRQDALKEINQVLASGDAVSNRPELERVAASLAH